MAQEKKELNDIVLREGSYRINSDRNEGSEVIDLATDSELPVVCF
jgi:hypothetical protein